MKKKTRRRRGKSGNLSISLQTEPFSLKKSPPQCWESIRKKLKTNNQSFSSLAQAPFIVFISRTCEMTQTKMFFVTFLCFDIPDKHDSFSLSKVSAKIDCIYYTLRVNHQTFTGVRCWLTELRAWLDVCVILCFMNNWARWDQSVRALASPQVNIQRFNPPLSPGHQHHYKHLICQSPCFAYFFISGKCDLPGKGAWPTDVPFWQGDR